MASMTRFMTNVPNPKNAMAVKVRSYKSVAVSPRINNGSLSELCTPLSDWLNVSISLVGRLWPLLKLYAC